MSEQRRFPRARFREALGVETRRFDDFQGASAFDLSVGGVRLRSEQFMALDTPVRIRFQLDDEQMIILIGKVAWVKKEAYGEYYQTGVEFQEEALSNVSRKRIQDYIEEEC